MENRKEDYSDYNEFNVHQHFITTEIELSFFFLSFLWSSPKLMGMGFCPHK